MTSRYERQQTALETAEKRLAQAQVRRDKAAARLKDRQRATDTRSKIMLGGALLALAEQGHTEARNALGAILRDHAPSWPERDKKALTEALKARRDRQQR